jgi:hypothetical protein
MDVRACRRFGPAMASLVEELNWVGDTQDVSFTPFRRSRKAGLLTALLYTTILLWCTPVLFLEKSDGHAG